MWFTLIAVALGVALGIALLAIAVCAGQLAHDAIADHRRREQIDDDARDALEAWGEPIPMIWPTRAPQNGDPWGDDEPSRR